MKMYFNRVFLLSVLFLLWSSALADTIYTIQNVTQVFGTDTFWVSVQEYKGDAILVNVIDKSKSGVPAIIQTLEGRLIANFKYTLPSFYQGQKPLPNGLFHFFKDKDAKLNNEYVLRFSPNSERTFIWSKVKQDYYGYSGKWHAIYDSSGKDPNPFTFKCQDKDGEVHEFKIGMVVDVGGVGDAAAGAGGTGRVEWDAAKVAGVATVPGMIPGFKNLGEVAGWNIAQADPKCTNVNHIIRRNFFDQKDKDIFEYVTGTKESKFDGKSLDEKLKFFNDYGKPLQNTVKCGTIGPDNFQCGTINIYKLDDILAKEKEFASSGKKASFNIIYYHMSSSKDQDASGFKGERKFRKFADVGALQARPENRDAVFQLASRPNCLECARVYRGKEFSELTGTSAVQGEEAAYSAFPGGFARMFCDIPDIGKDKNPKNNGAINLFKYTNLGPFVNSGGGINIKYVDKAHPEKGFESLVLDTKANWWNNLLICFHEGIAVTTGFTCVHRPGDLRRDDSHNIDYNSANCNERVKEPNKQLINQVPVCALNLKNMIITKELEDYSKQLLKAFYKGTILSSIMHGKDKIFLTFVGGSAFRNDIAWIVEAITEQEKYITKYGLTVFVVFFDWPSDPEKTGTPANKREPLYKMVERIGGNELMFTINNDNGKENAFWMFYEGGKGISADYPKIHDAPEKFNNEVFGKILTDPLQFSVQQQSQSPLQVKLDQLKINLNLLKNKLEQLKLKLSALGQKIEK